LQIIDIDKEENIPLIFEYKIDGIPHTICYNIRGEIMHSFPGVKTPEEFDNIVYYRTAD
jgi:thioredoxin-related protein